MIVYIPTPITSVEQAEALPEGTVAIQPWGHGTTARTLTNGRWITPSGSALPNAEAIGFTALVPVEAEEETRVTPEALVTAAAQVPPRAEEAARIYAIPPGRLMIQQQTRLVTPWTPTEEP